jgi:hypothetical protein
MPKRSYAVWWNEDSGPRHVGKLEIAAPRALLSGNGSRRVALTLDGITSVVYERGEVLVAANAGLSLRIGSLDAPGALREVAARLMTAIQLDSYRDLW